MSVESLNRVIARARDSMDQALANSARVDRSIGKADRVLARIDRRDGPARDAARRERQRLNADLKRRAARAGLWIGLVSIVTIIVGLAVPIGMFGFLAAVGLAVGVAALLAFFPGGTNAARAPAADLPNGEMVRRFDSYVYRSRPLLPPPAQAELDSISAALPPLRQTLERLDSLDPAAQDARRLMSKHLPELIDRYLHVPAAYRDASDGEGLTVDQRLVEGLSAGRRALSEITERLARSDMLALEAQGRFLRSRYSDEEAVPIADGDGDISAGR